MCGNIVLPRGQLACPSCEERQPPIGEPVCLHCGKPVAGSQTAYCSDCAGKESAFVRGFALWNYDAVMKWSIGQFKYHGRREYRDYYVEKLLAVFGERLRRLELEAVIPVPVHPNRYRQRGYNQAELLAEGVAEGLGVPVIRDLLLRKRDTAPQKELNPGERRHNLSTAFQINVKSREWKHYRRRVLLVDDIYTTGSTAEACAETLRQAGIGEIYVLCLCIGKGV